MDGSQRLTHPIANDECREVVQVDLSNGEERRLIDGGEPFAGERGDIARFVIAGDGDPKTLTSGLRSDSDVVMLLPEPDLDSETMSAVAITFYTGASPLVWIAASEPIPRETFDVLVNETFHVLKEADLSSGGYHQLADETRYVGLRMLRRRTREIEQSVRDALDDEELSPADYTAMRRYPARLAMVENLARQLREKEPEWNTHRPSEGFQFGPVVADFLFKHIDEAGSDAREAVARLSGLIASQQVVLAQRQASDTARFQRLVTIVGAAVLVPGLVAAIFGANVGFRGRESTEAFWAMLFLMFGSGIASYALIRSLETQAWIQLGEHRPFAWLKRLSHRARLLALMAVALVALAAGVFLLSTSASPDTQVTIRGASRQHRKIHVPGEPHQVIPAKGAEHSTSVP